jgi:hypothetical protein
MPPRTRLTEGGSTAGARGVTAIHGARKGKGVSSDCARNHNVSDGACGIGCIGIVRTPGGYVAVELAGGAGGIVTANVGKNIWDNQGGREYRRAKKDAESIFHALGLLVNDWRIVVWIVRIEHPELQADLIGQVMQTYLANARVLASLKLEGDRSVRGNDKLIRLA